VAASLPARLEGGAPPSLEVEVEDLSVGGCRLVPKELGLQAGARLTLRLDGMSLAVEVLPRDNVEGPRLRFLALDEAARLRLAALVARQDVARKAAA
jgi:hypothetical protein